jgi:hypothetical protein
MSAAGGGERMPKFLVTIFQILSAMLSVAQESKLSPEQKQEKKYWQAVEAWDRKGSIALWDEEFVGWPCSIAAKLPVCSLQVQTVCSWQAPRYPDTGKAKPRKCLR